MNTPCFVKDCLQSSGKTAFCARHWKKVPRGLKGTIGNPMSPAELQDAVFAAVNYIDALEDSLTDLCDCKKPGCLTGDTYCFKCHRPTKKALEKY